jgi:glycine dehydrogenase subunit 1
VGAVVVGYPNYLGILEDTASARAVANDRDALLIVGADPVAAGVLKTSGDWGADIFVGEGQPFGTPLAFGGPYLGLFACTSDQIRRLPGRIVGETVDTEGRRAFVTTLRAREQDIRREKATSNVCTNQTLMAVTAAIQMSWLGTEGLREIATRCAQGAHYLYEALLEVPGVSAVSDAPFFREFAFRTTRPARELLADVASRGFMAGVAASDLCAPGDASLPSADLDYVIVSTVTEKRTKVEIDALVAAIAKAVQS